MIAVQQKAPHSTHIATFPMPLDASARVTTMSLIFLITLIPRIHKVCDLDTSPFARTDIHITHPRNLR